MALRYEYVLGAHLFPAVRESLTAAVDAAAAVLSCFDRKNQPVKITFILNENAMKIYGREKDRNVTLAEAKFVIKVKINGSANDKKEVEKTNQFEVPFKHINEKSNPTKGPVRQQERQ